MDLIGEERGRLARVASWFDASPTEVTGLAVLLVCALAATTALVWAALGRPDLPAPPPDDEAAVGAGGVGDGDHRGVGAVGHPAGEGPAGPGDHPQGVPSGPLAHGDPGELAGHTEVTVHVAGAVAAPGVVTLAAGARVTDAIEAAGGLLAEADTARINLARPLQDGEHLLVLREGEEPPAHLDAAGSGDPGAAGGAGGAGDAAGAGGGGPDGGGDGPIDINTASVQQLETLPGIGPAIAGRIVQHREQHGPFRQPGDLRDVSGIGEKRFQDLADRITVG